MEELKYKKLSEQEVEALQNGHSSAQTMDLMHSLFPATKDIDGLQFLDPISNLLRENQMLHINVNHSAHSQTFSFKITGSYHEGEAGLLNNSIFVKYGSYYESLDKGVFEAMRLIREGRDIDAIRGLK